MAWRPDVPSKAEGWATRTPEPDSRPDLYFRDLVMGLRPDGGWTCVHHQPLELCPICVMRMDVRYRRLEAAAKPEEQQ